MKAESLNALLIDRELGELTPETVELLENWLAEHPEQTRDIGKLQETLAIAQQTVRHFPELGRSDSKIVPFRRTGAPVIPLALAACLVLLLGASSWVGFKMGRRSTQARLAIEPQEPKPMAAESSSSGGPWAKYALASSPHGGLTVVRKNN